MKIYIGGVEDYKDGRGGVFEKPRGREGGAGVGEVWCGRRGGGGNGEVREWLFGSMMDGAFFFSLFTGVIAFSVLLCEERRRCLASKRRVAGSWGLCGFLSGDQSF